MTLSVEQRQSIREAFHFCCGYCGISEIDVGGLLEIDHFQPLRHGGNDDLDNLIYACTTCNRYKGSYWPTENAPASFRLLHPLHDDLEEHLQLAAGSRLVGLTARGWFHIRWLRLNRPQLVQLRQLKSNASKLSQSLADAEATQAQLRQRIRELEQEVEQLRRAIARLTR